VGRCDCNDCELLRDFYWLKVNRFLLTLRSFAIPHTNGPGARTDQDHAIKEAKEEALRALCVLVSHLKTCYALDREQAA
jgi:hypothetical protein